MINKTLSLAKSLISIESTQYHRDHLHKVLDLACEPLKTFYIKKFLSQDKPSVLISNTNNIPPKFKILLNAHLDVVPGKPDQFKPTDKDGKLYGRGAADMKASAAVLISVFQTLASKIQYPLGLMLTTDEEIGGHHGVKYQLEQGIIADFVIAGDSPGFDISHAAKGIIWLDIETTGQSAHGAYPWLGQNAIAKMSDLIQKLNAEFPIPNGEAWVTTANIAKINTTNTAYNRVPDQCSLAIDIRYIPEEADKIIPKIKSLIPKGITYTLKTEPHQFTDPENPYILSLQQSIKSVTGQNSKLVRDHGASDIRHFQTFNIPGCLLGPIGEGLHSDSEWVDINSLNQFSSILKDFLLKI